MTTEFLWNSSRIWSELSSKIRWLRNFYEILQGFWSEFWLLAIVFNNSDDYEILQELDDHGILVKFFQDLIRILVASQFRWQLNSSRVRWPQNSCEIIQGFWSEFWWPAIVSNNSDDYEILQELDDHGILVIFFQDFNQNYFQELDDHRILMKFWKDFDQN